MTTVTICNARKNLYKLSEVCLNFDEEVLITTKHGNCVLINNEKYNSLIDSLNLAMIPGMYESIKEGTKNPSSKLISIDYEN